MVTSDFRSEVEIMVILCILNASGHNIIGTVRSLWTWLWGRYHVPQNAFLVLSEEIKLEISVLKPYHWETCADV